MKKILVSLLLFMLMAFSQAANSKELNVIAITQNDFSTVDTNNELSVKIVGNYEIAPNAYISDGTILNGNIVEVRGVKKNKRDAFAYIQFTKFKLPHQNEMNTITTDFAIAKLSQYTQLNSEKLQKAMGVPAQNPMIEYIAYPVNYVKDTQNGKIFENKIFKQLKTKGNELNLPQGSYILLTFTNN